MENNKQSQKQNTPAIAPTAIGGKTTITATDITKFYGKREVVRGITFHISAGECVGLLGPNGAGKTTSFYMLVGLIKPDRGRVHFGDTDITSYPIHKRARIGMAYLPQESSIFRKMTVRDNILTALQLRRRLGEGHDNAKDNDNDNDNEKDLKGLVDRFALGKVLYSEASVLSGGERRRLEIARCLAIDPTFVMLDEPFAGVDPVNVSDIKNIISELTKDGIGVLITDHNVRDTLSITNRSYIMIEGAIVAEGESHEIANNPQVRKKYLGEEFTL